MPTPSLSFFRHFATLRVAGWTGRSPYRILDLVFITLCATIANADNWVQIEAWARQRRDWLARFCDLPRSWMHRPSIVVQSQLVHHDVVVQPLEVPGRRRRERQLDVAQQPLLIGFDRQSVVAAVGHGGCTR